MNVQVKYISGYTRANTRVSIKITWDPQDSCGLTFRGEYKIQIPYKQLDVLYGEIECIKNFNTEYSMEQIIPIGLITLEEGYNDTSIFLIQDVPVEEYYKLDLIIDGILKAIQIKYKGVKAYHNFLQGKEYDINLPIN